jgi:SAM-dependent methyltransferase
VNEPDDPFSRVNYRRLVAWPERIRREGPALLEVLAGTPSRRVLDLGCGTGEHSRFLAANGFDVVGVDRSEEMLRAARAGDGGDGPDPSWIPGSLADLGGLLDGEFGGAICLGNVLPSLTGAAELDAFLKGLGGRLLPGAPFFLQLLNYDRILDRNERALPVNVREEQADGEAVVFLRLMTPSPDGGVVFTPSTLRYRPGCDPPLEVIAAHDVRLRGWRAAEVGAALERAGFASWTLHGDIRRGPYLPDASGDLVVLARR